MPIVAMGRTVSQIVLFAQRSVPPVMRLVSFADRKKYNNPEPILL